MQKHRAKAASLARGHFKDPSRSACSLLARAVHSHFGDVRIAVAEQHLHAIEPRPAKRLDDDGADFREERILERPSLQSLRSCSVPKSDDGAMDHMPKRTSMRISAEVVIRVAAIPMYQFQKHR